jgi:hypothetical protein
VALHKSEKVFRYTVRWLEASPSCYHVLNAEILCYVSMWGATLWCMCPEVWCNIQCLVKL